MTACVSSDAVPELSYTFIFVKQSKKSCLDEEIAGRNQDIFPKHPALAGIKLLQILIL